MFQYFATVLTVIKPLKKQWLFILITQQTHENWSWIQNWVGVYIPFTQRSSQQISSRLEHQYSCLLMEHEWKLANKQHQLTQMGDWNATKWSASLPVRPDGWWFGCRQFGRCRTCWRPWTLVISRNYQLLKICIINRANHSVSLSSRQQPAVSCPALSHAAEFPVRRLWVGGALLPER